MWREFLPCQKKELMKNGIPGLKEKYNTLHRQNEEKSRRKNREADFDPRLLSVFFVFYVWGKHITGSDGSSALHRVKDGCDE